MDRQISSLQSSGGKLKRELGFFAATAIGMGQMLGSGIYMAPQGLAAIANPKATILAFMITGIGTILLALCFGRLGQSMPSAGSAVIYTYAAFGRFPSFLVGWSYWCCCWIGNGAIILGGVSYASRFFPSLAENGLHIFLLSASLIWIYTLINIRGVKVAGCVNLTITVLKYSVLLVFVAVAIPSFDVDNLRTVATPEVSGLDVLPAAIAYTLWTFAGFEGVSMNAGEVKNRKVVKWATISGTVFVVVLYLLLIVLAMGNMPQDELARSSSPFSDIMSMTAGGSWAASFVALGVCISVVGCIGAWIMSSARVVLALSETKNFPRYFSKVHAKYRTPYTALLLNASLMTIMLSLSFLSPTSIALYNFLMLLAVMSLLVFYVFGAASEIVLLAKKAVPFNLFNFIWNSFLGLMALAYAIYAIYGSGAQCVMYGFLLLLFGIPFYIYIRFQNDDEIKIRKDASL